MFLLSFFDISVTVVVIVTDAVISFVIFAALSVCTAHTVSIVLNGPLVCTVSVFSVITIPLIVLVSPVISAAHVTSVGSSDPTIFNFSVVSLVALDIFVVFFYCCNYFVSIIFF